MTQTQDHRDEYDKHLEDTALLLFRTLLEDAEHHEILEPPNIRLERKALSQGGKTWRLRVSSYEPPMLGHEVKFVLDTLSKLEELDSFAAVGWDIKVQNSGLDIEPLQA